MAFDSLLGRDEGPLSDADMQAFTDFVLEIVLPPNPVRSLDNQLTAVQSIGRQVFTSLQAVDTVTTCDGCHTLDASQGFFGTGGLTTFENEPQEFKIPHLANAYQKIGMFGMPAVPFINTPYADLQPQGDQVRGFGFLHDGGVATVFDFVHASVFNLIEDARVDLEQFIHAFDTTFAPIVGQQVTLTSANAAAVASRISLLIARARTPFTLVDHPGAYECDLVVKGTIGDEARGYLLIPTSGLFESDRANEPLLTDAALRALATAPGQELTYTCAPPGSGVRMGIDRDEDGYRDRDEIDAGSDPADPSSVPNPTPLATNTFPATPTSTDTPPRTATPPATDTPVPTDTGEPTHTPTDTPGLAATPPPTDAPVATRTPLPKGTPVATATPPAAICPGDCDSSGKTTVDELIRGVAIALGEQPISVCESLDTNRDRRVDIGELIAAVAAVLRGC